PGSGHHRVELVSTQECAISNGLRAKSPAFGHDRWRRAPCWHPCALTRVERGEDMERFEGRRIIVTGGASGIGQATVVRLLAEAGVVHTVDVDADGLAATRELAERDGVEKHLTSDVVDISDEGAVGAMVDGFVRRTGGVDVLVNAAGILRAANTHESTLDMWN